jgi:methionyl-tRNA formyltransferase
MDAGLVLAQSRRRIEPGMTASDLHDLLAADGAPLVEQVLRDAAAGALRPQPQDDALATRAPKLSRADGWVDFAAPTLECHGRINGLSPWPGVTVQFRSRPLRLLRATTDLKSVPAEPIKAAKTLAEAGAVTPGKLISGPEGLLFCGDRTLLRLLEVQPPGKRVMSWRDFANGHAVKSEEVLVGGRPSC